MSNIKKSSLLFYLIFLSLTSNLLPAERKAAEVINNGPRINHISRPIITNLDATSSVETFGEKLNRLYSNMLLGSKVLLILGAPGVVWYFNNLREKSINEINNLSKKWLKNQLVENADYDNYPLVRKSFHISAWRPEFTFTKIAEEIDKSKSVKDMAIMLDLMKDITGGSDTQAFVFHGDKVVNSLKSSDNEVLEQLNQNISGADGEIKEMRKVFKNIPFIEDIEKTFFQCCKDKKNSEVPRQLGLLYKYLNNSELNDVLAELIKTKSFGMQLLDRWLNIDKSEPYQKLYDWWFKKYKACVDAYAKLVPIYIRLNALDALVRKYRSCKKSGSSFNANIDANILMNNRDRDRGELARFLEDIKDIK